MFLTMSMIRYAVRRRLVVLIGLALAGGLAVPLVARPETADAAPTIQSVMAPGFKDITLDARPIKANIAELNKIGKDFANAYRVSRMRFLIKEPDKFRMEVWAGPLKFVHVISGGSKSTRAFGKDFRAKDFGDDPGKRQTPMDVGLITPGTLRGYDVAYISSGTEAGRPAVKFRLRFAHLPERYEVLTIDSERKTLLKRELYTTDGGKFKCDFTYLDHQRVGSLWLPKRIEVRNAAHKLAGVTEQKEFKINTGVSDSLFKL